jgi:putative phosphoserine phosphatase/1-acylglycerol-3-phosphate O-acyltransferase
LSTPRVRKLIREIEAGPQGPEVAAMFDLDRTLIKGYSAQDMLVERVRRREMSLGQLAEALSSAYQFSSGRIDFVEFVQRSAADAAGRPDEENKNFGRELFEKRIAQRIFPEARDLVAAHRRCGHTLAVVSSATPYQVDPVAEDLGIPHVVCTHLEVKKGICTGKISGEACYGEGKVSGARKLARRSGFSLDRSYFYSDSHEDLPLLEAVHYARALNPNWRLEEEARRQGWPVVRFRSRNRPTAEQVVRTGMAYGATLPAAWAGLTSFLMGSSVREARNTATTMWSELATLAVDLKVVVDGKEHLWSKRPAVFVFNHQSALDALVVAKLLRRDITGIAKKEVKRQPVIGQLFQAGGVVFIDRADRKKAIEAMQPAVEALRNGLSIAIAPEGTRSITRRLGPFKKGAFHLAIDAQVPMVPIVIRNAHDWMPKGALVSKPGVIKIKVLPPVDTSGWSKQTLDSHVAEVRQMFVDTLAEEG